MIDSILSKSSQKPGTIARLKVSPQTAPTLPLGLTKGEEQLAALTGAGEAATKKVRDGRKLDAYLRIFGYFKDIIMGTSKKTYTPQFSKVEVELIEPRKTSIKTEA